MARERFNESSVQPVTLRLIGALSHAERQYNLPTASEVAALIPGDGNPTDSRDILIETRSTGIVQRISELHPSFMSLQYPLLFPYGEDGYHVNIPLCNLTESTQRKKVTLRQYYCYRLHLRNREGRTLHKSGHLFQTYVVDGYNAVLEYELSWYKNHQNTIRSDLYNGLQDRFCAGETDCASIGRRVILPSSFTGGPRYMLQQYQDAMAVCRWAGSPDLFITMTCNPKWPEIVRHIQETTPGMSATDQPDVVARVFKIKLDELMNDIRKRHIFGRARAVIYMIDFQKRGLPHCHILVFLRSEDKIRDVDGIDRCISAELPSEEDDPEAYAVVRSQMMHGPCGPANLSSPCMCNGVCIKGFPKMYCVETFIRDDGWPCYRRPNNSREVVVGAQRVALDNRYAVPYNRELLVKYGCHINVEWCNQGMLVKYLFSYINKGPDLATAVLETGQTKTPFASLINTSDEIEEYINCRYISSSEACWRLLEFEMRYRDIPVERLPFHEEGCLRVYFHDCDDIEDVAQRTSAAMSKFTAWMVANERYPHARLLTYAEFPTQFTWHAREKQWAPRESGFSIGRIYYVSPTMGEKYYLRLLLNVVRGPTSFAEIRTVDNHVHDTYMDACNALGLLGNDDEWVSCIREASQWQMGNQLRDLFVTILLFCTVCDIRKLFFDCLPYLSEDVSYNQRRILQNQDIVFTDDEILHFTLLEIDRCLEGYNKRLSEFSKLPQVSVNVLRYLQNTLIAVERTYNVDEERNIFMALHNGLNVQQLDVFDNVVRSVDCGNGGVFFVFGSGGTGKTYLWKTMIAFLRSRGQIMLSVASSGIASLLLPSGRTANSRFKIPFDVAQDSTCTIDKGTDLAELIKVASLIIWDEAPLKHRYAFKAVDRAFRDVCSVSFNGACYRVFGGKTVVLGGDFHQILPVIPRAGRSEIVSAVINKPPTIWSACKVFCLTINMRLRASTDTDGVLLNEQREFSKWILDMGDGRLTTVPIDGETDDNWIRIPDDLLIPPSDSPLDSVINNAFPGVIQRFTDYDYLQERCILSSTNEQVDMISRHILEQLPGETVELLSSDSICPGTNNFDEMEATYPVEFLNTLEFSGIPNHVLKLKVGIPVILLRNLNLKKGLCNGTGLVVSQISRHVIEAVILTGTHVGEKAFIGRIDMTPNNTCWPFEMRRRQFPVKVCFAMTINKSQGETFKHVCAFLVKPVFTHGQLYVVASRVTSREGLRFYIDNGGKCSNNLTQNVVYKEVFYNLPRT